MTKTENRQRIKNEALKRIRAIFDPHRNFKYDPYDEASGLEQKGYKAEEIISDLERELKSL